jgi:tetratricopeptide (TPR) repeat protein
MLAVLLAAPAVSEVIPPESRPHAARMDEWRSMLDAADEALHGDRAQEAERIYTKIIDAAATMKKVNLLVARAVDGMAGLCAEQGRLTEARDYYRRAAEMWDKLLGSRQPRLATTLHNLAVVELALDQPEAARGHVLAALEIWELSFGTNSAQAQQSRALRERVASRMSHDRGDADRTW